MAQIFPIRLTPEAIMEVEESVASASKKILDPNISIQDIYSASWYIIGTDLTKVIRKFALDCTALPGDIKPKGDGLAMERGLIIGSAICHVMFESLSGDSEDARTDYLQTLQGALSAIAKHDKPHTSPRDYLDFIGESGGLRSDQVVTQANYPQLLLPGGHIEDPRNPINITRSGMGYCVNLGALALISRQIYFEYPVPVEEVNLLEEAGSLANWSAIEPNDIV